MWWRCLIGFLILYHKISGEPCAELELFQCYNERCIYDFMVCNNNDDCGDGSDEIRDLCSVVNKTKMSRTCPNDGHYFQCAGAPCLPLYRVCDDTKDCIYGTDESQRVCGVERYERAALGSGNHPGSGNILKSCSPTSIPTVTERVIPTSTVTEGVMSTPTTKGVIPTQTDTIIAVGVVFSCLAVMIVVIVGMILVWWCVKRRSRR